MRSIPQASRRPIRKSLAVAALVIVSAVNLAACGQHVERANLGRCTNLPNAGGALCEEVGGDYIFVDRFTGSMRRYDAAQAELIARASVSLASAQAATMLAGQASGSSNAGQRNCLANPGIACSGSLNNRMSASRSSGLTTVCSGGTCLSAGR
ncbi:hypothetical protein DFH01_26220 [Falsiroseomonas bella]|uniref:Lipoprotein n=1 Tax=Falsiroseomonas bella TaxID=2184016 RepID=A0A317F7W5_9PROT|nr:hypothetical protein [Falsiroseomonas bella]PWS34127.1 hypothetical protein DFH01_26220 [Falsiroseomonas bella]